ncbi:MAG: YhgE/Pip domain-containing protein [Oscillospiraceae bacterium]|nr:YhgE/Pip domain-containing protein [Oscillospiraceae bacterium]
MKNVFKIFISDVKAIGSHFFALAIAIAVCFIPALYAWFNIYANWDPYGNTGNISIALTSMDEGYTLDDGTYVNKGREIVEEMAQKTSIHWVVTQTREEAVEGVRAGDYYGALVLGEQLSRNMYDISAALKDKQPSIMFYQNKKINAVANKITETAASTAEHNIQEKYLSILIEKVLNKADETLSEMDGEQAIDKLIETLTNLRGNLLKYSSAIQTLIDNEGNMVDRLDGAAGRVGGFDISDHAARFNSISQAVTNAKNTVLTRVYAIQERLDALYEQIDSAAPEDLSGDMIRSFQDQLRAIRTELEALQQTMPDTGGLMANTVEVLIQRADNLDRQLQQLLETGVLSENAPTLFDAIKEGMKTLRNLFNDNLLGGFIKFFDAMARDLELLSQILYGVNSTVADIGPVLMAAKSTIYALDGTLRQLKSLLDSGVAAVDKLLKVVVDAKENDLLGMLVELVNGDPEEFAAFLSEPVQVQTTTIYPVSTYGTAMAPFYSTLAIWVGCVVLAAILKVHADPTKLENPTPGQLYWGRFIIYFLLSQIQTAVILLGDVYLLGCQCVNLGLLLLAGAVTSFVFTALIYSMVLSFGDVGKAIVVVVMIVQIAGSSGSYPIEILPEIFSKIYIFFPYPYAINAMREAICGLYRYDYYWYLAELMIFGVLGLLIGLVIRKPFVPVNEFIEEEMEESGFL